MSMSELLTFNGIDYSNGNKKFPTREYLDAGGDPDSQNNRLLTMREVAVMSTAAAWNSAIECNPELTSGDEIGDRAMKIMGMMAENPIGFNSPMPGYSGKSGN